MSIKDLTPEELRRFIQTRHEKTYRIIDVRQPGEYEFAHIPGAQLLSLPRLIQDLSELPRDRDLVFYCRNGARSTAAAVMVVEERAAPLPIYHLEGGIMAWEGAMVADLPGVALFDGQSLDEMMITAMNLEKGAWRFYNHVYTTYAGNSWAKVFSRLAKVETEHAEAVYGFWRKTAGQVQPFEAIYEQLSGEVLEGGQTLDAVLSAIEKQGTLLCMDLLEMALKMEYRAYDLYRTMAGRVEEAGAREMFITIAQAEKGHMRALAGAVEVCAGNR